MRVLETLNQITDYLGNTTKSHLDPETSLAYASLLKENILGKDKQEKVNSIVILAKLLDVISSGEAVSEGLVEILNHELMETLFAVISLNMSTETYKAILKTCMLLASGTLFRFINDSIDDYIALFDALTEYIDVIDIMADKFQQDNKITYNTISFITDLIDIALKFDYDGIIPIAKRIKRVGLFDKVNKMTSIDDDFTSEPIARLKVAYYRLNEFLHVTRFSLSIKSHQVMLNNLVESLDIYLNENGTPATAEEYISCGFSEDPKNFISSNFTILSAMELCIILRSPIPLFKKRFQQELLMNNSRTFPLTLFVNKLINMCIQIFEDIEHYPNIHSMVLEWETIIYCTMNSCLILWQNTKCQLEIESDVERIIRLLNPSIESLETDKTKSIEECFDLLSNRVENLRGDQVQRLKELHRQKWGNRLLQFNENLSKEAMDFLCEQRVIQLLKGSWVYTERYGDLLLNREASKQVSKFYFILLSPNRKMLYYKKFSDKLSKDPTFEQMETKSINLSDIVDFVTTTLREPSHEQNTNMNAVVSVRGTISYKKITLIGENNSKLLSFVTDTEVNQYVWLDGLKMLKGMVGKGDLSEETEKQLNTLIEIRRNTQLLNLEDSEIDKHITSHVSNSEEEDVYDLNELEEITNDTFVYK